MGNRRLVPAPAPAGPPQVTNAEGISTYHLILQAGPDEKAQRGVLWILDRIGPDAAKAPIMVRWLQGALGVNG